MRTPILIYSDTPSAGTGLARICRELATRIAINMSDVFDVATIGYGGPTSTKLPFHQFSWTFNEEWIIRDLPDVWQDFAGGRKGILLTIQDPSRMMWLARPETCTDHRIRQYLQNSPPFALWGYLPLDAVGPKGKYSLLIRECLMGYKRLLCYSEWAEKIALATVGIAAAEERDLQSLPHGIDTSVFYQRPKWRQRFGYTVVGQDVKISDDDLLIGIVATNQPRKDLGLMIEVVAELAKRRKTWLWIHTDILNRTWDIPLLLSDFGLENVLISLKAFPDDIMARLYSACDLTLAPGLGEGFGYPIFESMACRTPVVHGDYGGAPEHMPDEMLVIQREMRLEGLCNSYRPVFFAGDWVKKIGALLSSEQSVILPPHLDWNNLWPRWEKWLRKGVR